MVPALDTLWWARNWLEEREFERARELAKLLKTLYERGYKAGVRDGKLAEERRTVVAGREAYAAFVDGRLNDVATFLEEYAP